MKNAIFGTDLSKASDKMIEHATELKLFGISRIFLTYVLNMRSVTEFAEYDMDSIKKTLEKQKNRLQSFGFQAETRIVMGIPALELMRQAKIAEADLVVIGSRGQTWSKSTLGETASEVLHNIHYPVLLMAFDNRPDPQEQEELRQEEIHHFEKFIRQFRKREPKTELLQPHLNRHVLHTTDFSDFSENAFQWLKSRMVPIPKLTLLHIQDEVKIGKYLADKLEEFNRIDAGRLERLKEQFNHVHPETEIDMVLDYGNPKQLIAQYIRDHEISLAVMGSQGRGYISEFFMGSVSLRIARQADSNLLIIPYQQKLG